MKKVRGQTLILFAITLLLLSMMVLVTLELGSRTRDRVETQIAADAAAYSEAVATARAFNQVALLNRTSISLMVSMAATQSLISWSGAVRGVINNAPPGCVPVTPLPPGPATWDTYDAAAGAQVASDQGVASGLAFEQSEVVDNLVNKLLHNQQQAQSLVNVVGNNLEAKGIADGQNLNITLVNNVVPPSNDPRINPALRVTPETTQGAVWATMGSRGDPWVTSRNGCCGGSGFGDPGAGMSEAGATTYSGANHRAQTLQANSVVSWAEDDNGVVNMRCAGTTTAVPIKAAWVASSADQYHDDQHMYDGSLESMVGGAPVWKAHTLGTCAVCPGIWPFFVDFQSTMLSQQQLLFGQPVMMAVIDRDYLAQSAKVWNLGFRFTPTRTPRLFDNASHSGAMSTQDVFRHQVAVASGIAYYHRANPHNFQEPPNLFNPFWRATLVSGAVAPAGSPITQDSMVQAAGFPIHSAALNALGPSFAGY